MGHLLPDALAISENLFNPSIYMASGPTPAHCSSSFNLFPKLDHLAISSPRISSGEIEEPEGALPLRGTLRLSGLIAASHSLLCGVLLVPLRLEEISITDCEIVEPETLDRLIEMCAPTLKKLELAHMTSCACHHADYVWNLFADHCLPGIERNPVAVNLSPCLALRELATNTVTIKRPSLWIETMLSTINLQATHFERVTINVQCQISSPNIGDQAQTEAWESVEDVLYGLALKFDSCSRFELVFVANLTYDEGDIELGGFLERLRKVAVVRFARTC